MLFPSLARFADLAILLLRLLVAAIFFSSGFADLKNPAARSSSLGTSLPFTIFLGAAELLASLALAFGLLLQPASFGLILIMLGAIQKKIFVWHTGFWGKNSFGWHYDLLLLLLNLLFLFTSGGRFVLSSWPSSTP